DTRVELPLLDASEGRDRDRSARFGEAERHVPQTEVELVPLLAEQLPDRYRYFGSRRPHGQKVHTTRPHINRNSGFSGSLPGTRPSWRLCTFFRGGADDGTLDRAGDPGRAPAVARRRGGPRRRRDVRRLGRDLQRPLLRWPSVPLHAQPLASPGLP